MEGISSSIIEILQYLLPGFLSAWIFHSLTSHALPGQLDRIIHALVLTVVAQFLLQTLNHYFPIEKHPNSDLLIAILLSIIIGLAMAYVANNDWLHTILRRAGVTKRTSYASEWFGVLYNHDNYLVLHLRDGRRLMGWASNWPSDHKSGHFLMANSAWIDNNNEFTDLHNVEGVLIPADMVEFIEIIKEPEEVSNE